MKSIKFLIVLTCMLWCAAATWAEEALPQQPEEEQAPAAEEKKEKRPPEGTPQQFNQMKYGSLLSATFENRKGGKHFTHKGIAITLGTKEAPAYMIFDTELMRYSSAWTGERYLHFYGVPYDGAHGPMPSPWGAMTWAVRDQRPGVALSDTFEDPRPQPYGPLPRDNWPRYAGLYRHGEKVVLAYTIAGCDVLELPSSTEVDGVPVFIRQLQIGPASKTINIIVKEDSAYPKPTTRPTNRPIRPLQAAILDGAGELKSTDDITYLSVPPHEQTLHVAIAVSRGEATPQVTVEHVDLSSLCKGGPSNWPEVVETKGVLGTGDGPYVVDTITAPEENPYNSWMRFGALDFFSDGTAAVTTWSGDVWLVSGIDDKLEKVTWKRFAAGLFQPLGLKIVRDEIYVLGRDQITKLKDLNGDREADVYECFNNDCMVGPWFHEFAFDLQCDSNGYFYYVKGGAVSPGGRGWQNISPHNGTMLQVSPDGKKLEVFATGLRAPNGTSCGPNDELTASDNEGTWMPVCRLNLVRKGSFLGVKDLAHREEAPSTWGELICWLPYPDVDNSSGGGVWVTSDKWGPFQNRLLHTSYGQCSLFLVMIDEVGGVTQGATVRFPLEFESGICRGRIGPKDGQVYLTGLKGWQTRAAKDACFQRVRYTGKPVNMPTSFSVKENGIEIGFTAAVDSETAADPDSYDVEQWNYIWSEEYGSPEVHIDDPTQKGRQPVKVSEVRVGPDGKSILLVMPEIQPVMQIKIGLNVDSADGEQMKYEINGTLNKVPNWKPKPQPTTSTKPVEAPAVSVK